MKVFIDDFAPLEVEAFWAQYGGAMGDRPEIVIPFLGVSDILERWADHDRGVRNYRFGGQVDDSSPDMLFVIHLDGHGEITVDDIDPFWDGVSDLNAYALAALRGALGPDVMRVGDVPPMSKRAAA